MVSMLASGRPSFESVALCVLSVFLVFRVSSPQIIGVDICACQPSVVKFRLDFSLICPSSNVSGPGINETSCIAGTRLGSEENITDQVPVSISKVQVLELDQNLQIMETTEYTDETGYFDGDEISYTALVEREPESITADNFPRGFQVTLTGVNAQEEPLVNQWAITYNNECGLFYLLEVGEQIGWSVFVSTLVY